MAVTRAYKPEHAPRRALRPSSVWRFTGEGPVPARHTAAWIRSCDTPIQSTL